MSDDGTPPVGLLDLTRRVLHLPSATHGIARCGTTMPDPWAAGPWAALRERARTVCQPCHAERGHR